MSQGYGSGTKTPFYVFESLERGQRTALGTVSLGYGDQLILNKADVERYNVRKMLRDKKIAYRGQTDSSDARVGM